MQDARKNKAAEKSVGICWRLILVPKEDQTQKLMHKIIEKLLKEESNKTEEEEFKWKVVREAVAQRGTIYKAEVIPNYDLNPRGLEKEASWMQREKEFNSSLPSTVMSKDSKPQRQSFSAQVSKILRGVAKANGIEGVIQDILMWKNIFAAWILAW